MTLPGTWDTIKILGMIALALVLALTRDEDAESPRQASVRRAMLATLWISFALNAAEAVLPAGWSTIRAVIWPIGGVAACVMVVRLAIADRREWRAEREAARIEAEADRSRLGAGAP